MEWRPEGRRSQQRGDQPHQTDTDQQGQSECPQGWRGRQCKQAERKPGAGRADADGKPSRWITAMFQEKHTVVGAHAQQQQQGQHVEQLQRLPQPTQYGHGQHARQHRRQQRAPGLGAPRGLAGKRQGDGARDQPLRQLQAGLARQLHQPAGRRRPQVEPEKKRPVGRVRSGKQIVHCGASVGGASEHRLNVRPTS